MILISARARQEGEVEGLLTGADDYLVKPFSSKEILARVEKTLRLTTLRHAAIEHELRFHHLAHHPEVMTWITEDSGNCIFLSETWYDFTGQTEETGLGFGWLEAVHPDDRVSTQQKFHSANLKRETAGQELHQLISKIVRMRDTGPSSSLHIW